VIGKLWPNLSKTRIHYTSFVFVFVILLVLSVLLLLVFDEIALSEIAFPSLSSAAWLGAWEGGLIVYFLHVGCVVGRLLKSPFVFCKVPAVISAVVKSLSLVCIAIVVRTRK
jgi:hypothetical protein